MTSRARKVSPSPGGGFSPAEDALVLFDRPLAPSADMARLSRFGDDTWRLTDAVFEEHAQALNIDFTTLPPPWRHTAKTYVWALINMDVPGAGLALRLERASISTIVLAWPAFKRFVKWLQSRGVTQFSYVTHDLLDDYLSHVVEQEGSLLSKYRWLNEVRRIWQFRNVLPAPMRLPTESPWDGEAASDLLGKTMRRGENLTPRISEATMQPLLLWSMRFIEELAPDIIAGAEEYRRLRRRSAEGRRLGGDVPCRPPKGQVERDMRAYIRRLKATGGALPGLPNSDGFLEIDWRHVGMILEYSFAPNTPKTPAGRLLVESGLPIAAGAYLDTPITAVLAGEPWRDHPITYKEARRLTRHLNTACLIVIAYLSGARPGEVLNLRRGCIERDNVADMWLMSGVFFKNATDADGNKAPAGAERRDPWVVVKPVADAVAILEQLHTHPLLFPSKIDGYRRTPGFSRVGQARSTGQASKNIHEFVDWINEYADRMNMDGVPLDGRGRINISRFRRTLAWFIRRRPRGLVAGSLQYGHVQTRLIQGYAGSHSSGFLDEYAYEDFLGRLDELAADKDALDDGEQVSGPAADRYRHRVNSAHAKFAGHVLTSGRQARDLLANPLLQIFHGDGMTCVFNPNEAACQLRGNADDPMVTPDVDDCRPRCPNIARTDRDIGYVRGRRDRLAELVSDTLAPQIRSHREQLELQRLDTILEKHEP